MKFLLTILAIPLFAVMPESRSVLADEGHGKTAATAARHTENGCDGLPLHWLSKAALRFAVAIMPPDRYLQYKQGHPSARNSYAETWYCDLASCATFREQILWALQLPSTAMMLKRNFSDTWYKQPLQGDQVGSVSDLSGISKNHLRTKKRTDLPSKSGHIGPVG